MIELPIPIVTPSIKLAYPGLQRGYLWKSKLRFAAERKLRVCCTFAVAL